MKKIIFTLVLLVLLPLHVNAGSIRWSSSQYTSNTYKIEVTAQDLSLNYLNGKLTIMNGIIQDIQMMNGWENKTGKGYNFQFTRNGTINGNYTIAVITVHYTNNSTYTFDSLKFGKYNCTKDAYGNLYNDQGFIVDQNTYNNSACVKSTDATLKSLEPIGYTLNKSFKSSDKYYDLYVPNNVNSISFKAVTNHAKAKITSGLSCNLTQNTNTCRIQVTSEFGNTETYYINVYKKYTNSTNTNTNNSSNNNNIVNYLDIQNFIVHNGTLNQNFDINKTYYEVKPDKNATNIYFELDTPFSHIISKKCELDVDICILNANINNKKYSYQFKIIKEEETVASVSNPTVNTTSQSVIKNNNTSTTSKKNTTTTAVVEQKDTTATTTPKEEVKENSKTEEKTTSPVVKKDSNTKKEETDTKETKETKDEETTITKRDIYIAAILSLALGVLIGIVLKNKKARA